LGKKKKNVTKELAEWLKMQVLSSNPSIEKEKRKINSLLS
jgi:hypothetical protein